MSVFSRIFKAVSDEISKPTSFVKGEAFEDYIRKVTFPKDRYKILNRAHNYNTNKDDYVDSSLKPDFEFQCLDSGKKFYVEAKFRSGYFNESNRLEWCKPYQLKRYQELDKSQPVFVALGIGEEPDYPEFLSIIPLRNVKFTEFYESFLDKYDFYPDRPIFSSYLWSLK